ncbi:MAG TPA: aconitate hydratase AcnA [Thermoanaerobaculia bacterium]|nr:aconitate hydratase AcnA [Thermoanaerobaculia bacterium]HQP88452.1 aconitate hydratase AcnA [Thermoanaerobaculia bacterium]
MSDSFKTKTTLTAGGATVSYYSIETLAKEHPEVRTLPYSLKVLLENLLRHEDGRVVKKEDVLALAKWDPKAEPDKEIAFHPARVLMQDFTGVPAVVDLAAMREAIVAMGGDPARVNPLSPADLVIDHSVQVDNFASSLAFGKNVDLEYERNRERYEFLRWGQNAFRNFRVVPPGTGICHQVNLEYLAKVVWTNEEGVAYPDTLVGTDSHTTMINGLGVLGWGVGGIEAEAALLGQPVSMLIPEVVGMKLHGKLPEGATATDLVLTVTQMLRKKGVVGKFVEFYGPGLAALPLTDRATIANMAPEYGATMGFFPVDGETVRYLEFTGRKALAPLVEAYSKAQGLWRSEDAPEPRFSDTLELNLADVVPSLAGPKRPQDRVALKDAKKVFREQLPAMLGKGGSADATVPVSDGRLKYEMPHGAVVISAITSCTNTSNPSVLVAAGLLAKKAVERGLDTKPWVKPSLAPGSKTVTDYLTAAGLMPYLEALGFHVVGYGCTTCIGNSGPLPEKVSEAVRTGDLVVASVLSGNRNFEGRVNPQVKMNFLASPPLVVAYALAGEMDTDLTTEPLGIDRNGQPVFLSEIWPTPQEVAETIARSLTAEQYEKAYGSVFAGDAGWQALSVPKGSTFAWDAKSTYVRKPTFFEDLGKEPKPLADVKGARCLALLGDSITTDHISPAGNIAKTSPAAKYLTENGVQPADFNQYGARRGNHEVMMRGTFANIRLKNLMLPGTEGGVTLHVPTGETMSIYDAAMKYQASGTPLVVLAGAEYGTGSSRDWAAKGTMLLGVKAVIAKSFERIHRSNLAGMGVLPLQFAAGEDATTLGLAGKETFEVAGVAEGLTPHKQLTVTATAEDGTKKTFTATLRLDTPNEVDYYRHGGILQFVLRQMTA